MNQVFRQNWPNREAVIDAITLGYKIEKRALKVSLEENSKVYDGYKFTPGVTFENLVPGEGKRVKQLCKQLF